MEKETEKINYDDEVSKLRDPISYWKPKAGKHIVKFKSNGEKHIVDFEDNKNVAKVKFLIDYKPGNDPSASWKSMFWDLTMADTNTSLWGQLSLFAKHNQPLIDQEINVLVVGEDKDKKYTILEAVDYMGKKDDEITPA